MDFQEQNYRNLTFLLSIKDVECVAPTAGFVMAPTVVPYSAVNQSVQPQPVVIPQNQSSTDGLRGSYQVQNSEYLTQAKVVY